MKFDWVGNTLLSAAFFVTGILALKQGQNADDEDRGPLGQVPNIMMVYVGSAIATVLLVLDGTARSRVWQLLTPRSGAGYPFWTPTPSLLWVLLFAVAFFLGNMLFFQALIDAPNPGYARALMTIEVVAVTLLSVVLFGSRLTLRHVVGITAICTGVAIVSTAPSSPSPSS